MRQGETERLGDHLAGGGRAHELAAAPRRAARPAAHLGGVLQRDLVAGEPRSERLHLGRVLGLLGEQRDATRHEHRGQVRHARQRHEHRRQALVAGGDAQHPAARGQRTDEAAQHDGGVVAVGEAVQHAGRAVGAAVARVADIPGERNGAGRGEFPRGLLHQQADLPVAGMVAEGDGRAVGCADAALGAEDEELPAEHRRGRPAHAGVLGPAEEVAARHLLQTGGVQRERAGWTGRSRAQRVDRVVAGIEDGIAAHGGMTERRFGHEESQKTFSRPKEILRAPIGASGVSFTAGFL